LRIFIMRTISSVRHYREKVSVAVVYAGFLLCAASCCCQVAYAGVKLPVDIRVEVSAGYDDNTVRTDKEKGSAFALYGLEMGKQFVLGKAWTLETLLEASYQDYERVEDNYLLQGSAALSRSLAQGRVLASIITEANAYRDDLIDEDDRNEFMAGIQVNWVFSSRLSLNLRHTWRWLDYRNWARPFAVRGKGRTDGPPGPDNFGIYANPNFSIDSPDDDLVTPFRPRDDRMANTGLSLDIFLPFSTTCTLHAGYTRLYSSLKIESYKQLQTGIGLVWKPADKWSVAVDGGWHRTKYHKANGIFRQTNYTRFAGMQVSRFWGRLEFFGHVVWSESDSSLDFENYNQTVTQCGFSWSF